MFGINFTNLLLGVTGLYIVLKIFLLPKKKLAPLPPGPRPLPFAGNIADLPPPGAQEWQHWLKHKDLYGPISSVTVFGQTIIILNDVHAAFELLEKRSALHSARPSMVFAAEMVGWEHATAMLPSCDRLRTHRKNFHQLLGTKRAISSFFPLENVETRRFLLRVLEKPDDLLQHIRTHAGAIILKITYGYTIEPHKKDPLVDIAEQALEQFSVAATPGAFLVDTVPLLKYLPDWFPGTGFKRTARAWKKNLTDAVEKPYAFARQQMREKGKGAYEESFLSKVFEEKDTLTPEEDHVAKWSAASIYTGGADTTVSSIACFFLAMTLYPDVQRKAQEEIDRVVGTDRLPGFEDREKLPYIDAIVKEILRWHPVAPMGLPHVTSEEDVYEGYRIPKGALLFPNIWAFTHDPTTYHDPMTFSPERFLSTTPEPDPHILSFGFGRRICPGRVLADSSIYLSVAQSLAVFDISEAKDINNDNKNDENEEVHFRPGVISHPVPFRASIKPRSAKQEALIRAVEREHPWQESDARVLEGIVY
ncbi:hypothetical protein VTN00DRAFT_6651 [Thermoascus crustaceus]|uniref:uncharacterized protein n=1 Tax=Thermoascus crustaceus TaxID=5088 RepID=UPI003743B544